MSDRVITVEDIKNFCDKQKICSSSTGDKCVFEIETETSSTCYFENAPLVWDLKFIRNILEGSNER